MNINLFNFVYLMFFSISVIFHPWYDSVNVILGALQVVKGYFWKK